MWLRDFLVDKEAGSRAPIGKLKEGQNFDFLICL